MKIRQCDWCNGFGCDACFYLHDGSKAILVKEKDIAAIYQIGDTGKYLVTDMSHPGDIYSEEYNLTLEEAERMYEKK